MSSTALNTLEPFSTLGMTGIAGTGPHYVNDASIVLPAGNQIIQQSIDTGERMILFGNRITSNEPRNEELTAFAVSHDSTYLALAALRKDVEPVINIYYLQKQTLYASLPQPKSVRIFFATFHMKQKLLLFGVSYPRTHSLIIYDLTTKQEVKNVSIPAPFISASFNPDQSDSSVIFHTATDLYYVGSASKTATKIDCPNYSKFTGFVYSLNERNVCIATSGRDLIFYQDFTFSHTMTITEESPIIYFATFNHGLVAATENYKLILFQHISVPKDLARSFQQGPIVTYGMKHPIVWASFSQSAHQMVIDVDHRQLLLVNMREFESNPDNAIINPNIVSHKGPVVAISSCAYKPMLVSCGQIDRTVIVWDYSKQASVLYHEFPEDLKDVAFHPSGDLIAVASSDKLYLMTVTVDDLIQRAEWPLFNCLSIQFSNGGHFLVAASHIITFINPYTQEIVATLRAHTGLINSLGFSPDDKKLVSSGSDGKIVVWSAVTQLPEWSLDIPKANFVSSVISHRGTVIAAAKTNVIHHLFSQRRHMRISEAEIGFTVVLFASNTCIILGDILGGITVVPFPFIVPSSHQSEFENIPQLEFSDGSATEDNKPVRTIPFLSGQTFKSHCGEVTRLCSSLDSKVLFTSATDSSICVFNILSANQTVTQSRIPILRCDIPCQQFFLVPQSRYDELQHGIEKLKRDIQSQQNDYEQKTIESLRAHQKNLDELQRQHREKKEKLNQQIEGLMAAMNDSTIKAALIYQNMEAAHMNEAKVLTNLYEQKLSLERSKCDGLQKEVEDLKCSYEERIYLLQQQYKSSLEELGNKIYSKQSQLQNDLDETNKTIQKEDDDMSDRMIALEVEFDQDRMMIDLEFHNKAIELHNLEKELNAKVEELATEIDKQIQIISNDNERLNTLKDERAKEEKEIKAQQHTLECKTSELHDREETLQRQENNIERLETSNNELTKFKGLMNRRIEEMSAELQPTKDEIVRHRAELDGTNEEIRTNMRSSQAKHRKMQDKQHQIDVLKTKLAEAQTALAKKRRVIQIFTADLREGVSRSTIDERTSVLKELHDKYVAVHDLEENIKDANDTINENTRQRKHLQESVMLLQKSVNQQKTTTMKHFEAKSAENSQLLSDLNAIQKENRSLRKRLDLVLADVDMLQSNLKRVQATAREQSIKRQRLAHSAMQQQSRVTSDWVKKNTSGKTMTGISVADGRGKYLHSK